MLMTKEDPIKTKSKLENLKNAVANIGQGVISSGIYGLLEKAFNSIQ